MIPLRDNLPSARPPLICILLILANLVVFGYEAFGLAPEDRVAFEYEYGAVPARFWNAGGGKLVEIHDPRLGDVLQLDTSYPSVALSLLTMMFLHGSLLHLVSNLWVLWIFGDQVEDRLYHGRFALFYVLCGILGTIAEMVMLGNRAVPCIGASGAIAGVLGAYMVSFPSARVLTLLPLFYFWQLIELPAVVFLGIWIALQFVGGFGALPGHVARHQGGIAFFAHIGGFVAGAILVDLIAPPLPHSRGPVWEPPGDRGSWIEDRGS